MGAFFQGGAIQKAGLIANVSPLAGEIGEYVSVFVPQSARVAMTSGVQATLVELTPPVGWWTFILTLNAQMASNATLGLTIVQSYYVNAATTAATSRNPFAYVNGAGAQTAVLDIVTVPRYFDGLEKIQLRSIITSTGLVEGYGSIEGKRVR